MKKRILALLVIAAMLLCLFTACDSTTLANLAKSTKDQTEEPKEKPEGAKENEDAKTDRADLEDDAKDDEKEEPAQPEAVQVSEDALLGDWVLVMEKDYNGKPDDKVADMEVYTNFYEEGMGMEAQISIYDDGGKLYADYTTYAYESHEQAYHMPVEIVQEPLYELCENREWSAHIVNPRDQETVMKFSLTGENKLDVCNDYTYDYEDVEEPWRYVCVMTYLRDGSNEYENRNDLKYSNTVTVSDVKELVGAIADNTKIILKKGVYDLNDLKGKGNFGSENVNVDVYDNGNKWMTIHDVSYLRLEAEKGAEVEICIESPYDPVLSFYDSYDLELDGLKCGHRVEPGSCGGSVISANNCSNISVKDCRLYGCGAYGLEANDSNDITLTDTEIYECSYGITSLANVYSVAFDNCSIHDNAEYSMVWTSGSGGVEFRNCTFERNKVKNDYDSFVSVSDSYGVSFRDCRFADNVYRRFAEGDVEIENCSFRDKSADQPESGE